MCNARRSVRINPFQNGTFLDSFRSLVSTTVFIEGFFCVSYGKIIAAINYLKKTYTIVKSIVDLPKYTRTYAYEIYYRNRQEGTIYLHIRFMDLYITIGIVYLRFLRALKKNIFQHFCA